MAAISVVALSFIVHDPADHGAVEREVAVREPAQVAQHLVSMWWLLKTAWVR